MEDWRLGKLVVILPPLDSVDQQFNRQMAQLFANQLGVKLRAVELYPHQVSNALSSHLAHFSAIGIRANEPDTSVKFGTPYQIVSEYVVCSGKQPDKQTDLNGRDIQVIADSAQEAALILTVVLSLLLKPL